MARLKRLWTNDELMGMARMVPLLRRMRTAATIDKPTIGVYFRKAFLGRGEPIILGQEAFAHAEELSSAAGDFFAGKLSKTTDGNSEYEKWQELLSNADRRFRFYGSTTYSRADMANVIGDSLIGRLRLLSIDPDYLLQWELVHNNNLGARSLAELLEQDIGVISPFSGDYLLACTYSSYLRRTRGKSFSVRPAALSADLSRVVIPIDDESNLHFQEKQSLGIYVDTTETGNTGRALFQALRDLYPLKEVHEPYAERKEFIPSKKIVDYLKKRGSSL